MRRSGTSTVSSQLVEHRAGELAKLESELCETRKRVRRKIRELDVAPTVSITA